MINQPTTPVTMTNGISPVISVITPQLRNPVYWDDLDMTWDNAGFTWDEATDATLITNIPV